MTKSFPTLLLTFLTFPLLSGCGYVYAYRSMQIKNDEQILMRMYRECIEKHVGDPDAIAKNCEPLVAPLRIRGLEGK